MTFDYNRNMKTIFSFSLIFFLLIVCNYVINRQLLYETISSQQKDAVKGVSKRISKWFQQKIDSTEAIRDVVMSMDHINNEDKVKKFLLRSTSVANFRNIYVGYEDDKIISGINWIKPKDYKVNKRPWFQHTVANNKVIVTSPYMDLGLKEAVVSICAPFKSDKSGTKGVVCGILPLEKIKFEILDISLPYDGFAFIVNYYGKIVLHPDSNKHLTITPFKVLNEEKRKFMNKKDKVYLYSQEKIRFSNWHIVTQLKKSSVYEKINFQLFINLLIYGISLLVFLFLNFFYYKNQKNIDENLQKTKSILKEFIQHGENGVLIIDNEDRIIFKNKLFRKFLLLSKLEDTKLDEDTNIFDKFEKNIKLKILENITKAKINYETNELEFDIENEEETSHLLFEIFPVLSEENIYQGVILSIRDITKKQKENIAKREQENILFQQSKMADLGEMIAAVSHQWRQPLNSLSIMIGNLLQFKKLDRLTDEIFEENLNNSLFNVQYLANTIDTFRNFYKPNRKWQTFNIISAVEEVKEILIPKFKGAGISVNITKTDNIHNKCLNYKNEFQQIIANLLQNSRDGILEDKECSRQIDVKISYDNHIYKIEVSDYGIGINPEFGSKLFKAFKTTKKEGTGSGLYLSRLIARKKLNGDLVIKNYSKPTKFLITLPCNEMSENA